MLARVAAAAVVAVVLAGCGDEPPSTSLHLVATNSFVGRATFTLECDPAGGDVPRPAAACARLAGDPSLLLRPKPFVCAGGTFSWWRIVITGHFHDEPVSIRTDTCWTPQQRLIRALEIGREIQRHVDPLSRPAYPGSGIPRSALARTVEIPEATPAWLLRLVRVETRRMGSARPERLAVKAGPASFVVTLEGAFVCERCAEPVASRVVITVGRASRRIDSVLVS